MKSIRESSLFNSNKRLAERKSIVGAFHAFDRDIFREKFWYPHEEMAQCVDMYNRNSFAQSAVNTMKDFIKGGDLIVKSMNEKSRKLAQIEMDRLDVDSWVDEVIENTIKTGNGYLEIDFEDAEWKKAYKCYPIADSSRIYINCDEFGLPKKKTVLVKNPFTKQDEMIEKRDEEEFFVQRIDAGFRHPKAKWYDMSYHVGFMFKKFRIYGIPINKRKIIHFKLNIGDTSIYGRSYLASALDDWETLKQIERSIAIIAKYKAVPRDIIMYGDKDNPATDDELDEFIVYLESLEKDESAIVNKPIKRESLAYAGQDINLDYMIQHIRKKIIAGIAPDFMMGLGDQVNKATAQISLISYILAIYSKRKLFLKPIEKYFLKPFCRKNGLEDCWLEFGELDFETQSEKVNRIGALWVQNLVTFNESRKMLGMPTIGDIGEVYYLEWQNSMMDSSGAGMGFPEIPSGQGEPEGNLPNGEDVSQVFTHNDAPNQKPMQDGGKAPFDPYQKDTDVPKFLQKKDLEKPGSSTQSIRQFFKKGRPFTRNNLSKLHNVPLPETYNLESDRDYSGYVEKHDAEHCKCEIEEVEKDIAKKEATITIDISEPEKKHLKEKEISFQTLMDNFSVMFDEPRLTEIYYKLIEGGWRISFTKDNIMIYCNVLNSDIVEYYTSDEIKELDEETKSNLISGWKDRYLIKGIKEE